MINRRFVVKVTDDNTEEGLINILAKMTGINSSEIELSNELLANMRQIDSEKLEIKKNINPFFDDLKSQNTKESNKKIHELIDLGKFIYYLGLASNIEIIECGEQPDFIIRFQDELIGVEHTGIYDDDVVGEIKKIKRIIDKCQDRLRNNRNDIKGLFNIIVVPSKLKGQLYSKESEISQTICDFIIAQHEHKEIRKPAFIDDVIKSEHSVLALTLGEDYWLAELTPNEIAKTISKKENKIDTYKSLKNINKCWLLIVIDGASSASSFNINLDTLPIYLTPFDRIYIFDNFKGTIIRGEKN